MFILYSGTYLLSNQITWLKTQFYGIYDLILASAVMHCWLTSVCVFGGSFREQL